MENRSQKKEKGGRKIFHGMKEGEPAEKEIARLSMRTVGRIGIILV